MALIKFGSIVTGISGKIGGQTFGTGRAGAYVRNTGTIGRAPSERQQLARNQLAGAAARWRLLSDNERTAWDNGASTMTYKNRLGDDKVPSGYQLFMQRNANVIKSGGTKVDNYVSASPPEVPEFDIQAAEEGLLEVFRSSVPADHRMIVLVTPQMSAGASPSLEDMVILRNYAGPSADASVDITVIFEIRFGTLQVGQRVAVAAQLIDTNSGVASPYSAISTRIVQ